MIGKRQEGPLSQTSIRMFLKSLPLVHGVEQLAFQTRKIIRAAIHVHDKDH